MSDRMTSIGEVSTTYTPQVTAAGPDGIIHIRGLELGLLIAKLDEFMERTAILAMFALQAQESGSRLRDCLHAAGDATSCGDRYDAHFEALEALGHYVAEIAPKGIGG